jgi:diguanylate cyclase (GGDEF)-like protein/PAS domain S-box-containing protein
VKLPRLPADEQLSNPAKLMPPFQDPDIYRDILDGLPIGISVLDLKKRIVFWSDGSERITGYSRIEVLGHLCTDNILLHCNEISCAMCTQDCPLSTALHDALPSEAVNFIHHKAGYRTQVHSWVIPLRDKHGLIIGVIQTFEGESAVHNADPSDLSMKEHRWLDDVTGLPNQAMMQSHLRESLGTFTTLRVPFGIVCVEIKDLLQFRSKYGHGAARSLLQVLARTLRNTVCATDAVGTWNETQFLAILSGCSEEAMHAISGRIFRMLSSVSIKWWGEDLSVAVSIGCAQALPGDSVESILQRAQDASQGNQTNLARAAASAGVDSSQRS